MLYLSKRINAQDLIIVYLSSKLKKGYCPYFGRQELNNFLTYFGSRKSIYGLNMNYEDLINSTINKHTKRTIDNNAHIELDEYNILKPNYAFSNYDVKATEINSLNDIERNEIDKLIDDFLIPYPKRKIIVPNTIEKENKESASIFSALLVEFIWNCYTEKYINRGLWPKQCTDIDKYLIKNDVAYLLEIPSIREEIILFYNSFARRLSGLIQREENLKVSSNSKKLLAYSNYLCLTKGYESLFKNTAGKYFELGIEDNNNEIDNSSIVNTEKAKKLVKILDSAKNYIDN